MCPQCGTRPEDWTDDDGNLLEIPRYEPVAIRCYGCTERAKFDKTIPEGERGVHTVLVTQEEYQEKYQPKMPDRHRK